MKYICNPVNIQYKYQGVSENGELRMFREAADPTLIPFKGKYYLFPSMTAGFLVSDNLVTWEYYTLLDVPIHDYAPDVRVIGDYLYFSASSKSKICSFFRSKDPVTSPFEEIKGPFPFWDPNLFVDDDGRVYFYWGCSNQTPIYGVELQLEDMKPLGEPVALIYSDDSVKGYERSGENHTGKSREQINSLIEAEVAMYPSVSAEKLSFITAKYSNAPYIEGAWMDKHDGVYYLQYACPGTEHNIYCDGVYTSESPLGPFTLAANNPYSYKPGGFITGAGHGSTMEDCHGNRWHAASMRISKNHLFERRLGLWPAGFDQEGELFCNQRYGDWPMRIDQAPMDPWRNPDWMLLSYGKPARASSIEGGKEASNVTDENIQTWWRAASPGPGEWVEIDLKHICKVFAIQINFADDRFCQPNHQANWDPAKRFIEPAKHYTKWLLEGSTDGIHYFTVENKTEAETDLSHDLIVLEQGIPVRYLRCTVQELPYNQNACISGLRVFGLGGGELPPESQVTHIRMEGVLDVEIAWLEANVTGFNVLWGFAPDKLYHSYMVFNTNRLKIGALVKGQALYVRVDTFNEVGITEGRVYKVVE